MAKVFDALQRAEEERRRRMGDEVSPVTPLDVGTALPAKKKHSAKRIMESIV